MKWSGLSIGRQIGVIALILSVLLATIIFINVLLVIHQNRNNWQENVLVVHQEANQLLGDKLAQVETTAVNALTGINLVASSDTEAQQQMLKLVGDSCSVVANIEVSASDFPGADSPQIQTGGFGPLIRMSELSDSVNYGILYSYWAKDDSGRRVQVLVDLERLSAVLPSRVNARTMLLDTNGQIIACSEAQRVGDFFLIRDEQAQVYYDSEGRAYAQRITQMNYGDYRLVTLLSDRSEVLRQVQRIIPINLIAALLMIMVVSVSFYFLHLSISKPISDMSDMLTVIRKRPEARFAIRLQGNREMVELSRSFNKMMDENERLNAKLVEANVKLYQAELIKRQTDMAMLVAQINPHFLYNTLEVIKGMAYKVGARSIADMTRALGTIFRYSLKAPDVVSLRQEVDMLKDYLTIQLARFGDRFQVHYDLPDWLMEQDVPKMILQPLCENAITHALEMMQKGGHLWVGAFMKEYCLYITVKDNGLGMDQATLNQVRSKLDIINDVTSLYETGSDGIGLTNVHGRIRMRYGEEYGLTIDSHKGKGTRVTLKMPGRRPQDCIRY